MTTARALSDALRDGADCPVLSAPGAALEPFALNFGRHHGGRPLVVVLASRGDHVAHALRVARSFRVAVSLRGAGHSCGRQGLAPGGILVVNRTQRPQVRLLGEGLVEASGRTTWIDLERILDRVDRTLPVRTSEPRTTIGGTLSVGGYGPRSIRHGAQTDHVERLDLILPDGILRACSPASSGELFRSALAGLGQVGVIERVVMRTRPRRRWRCVRRVYEPDLTRMAERIARVARRGGDSPQELQAVGGPEPGLCCFLVDGFATESQARSHRGRARGEETARVERDSPEVAPTPSTSDRKFWCDYALPLDGFPAFAAFVEARLDVRALRRNLVRLYLLCLRGPAPGRRAALDLRAWNAPERGLAIGVHLDVPPQDRAAVRRIRAFQADCLERALRLGGRPYSYGAHEVDETTLRSIYGEAYDRVRALRARLDPDGLLNRGLP